MLFKTQWLDGTAFTVVQAMEATVQGHYTAKAVRRSVSSPLTRYLPVTYLQLASHATISGRV